MRFLQLLLTRTYAKLLHLYPSRFRHEFLAEMQVVFEDLIRETAKEGFIPLLVVFLRELSHLPGSLFIEFWHEGMSTRGEAVSTTIQLNPQEARQGSWQTALFAGLPHLLIAIFVAIAGSTANAGVTSAAGLILLFLLIVGFCITVFFTWRDHWPAWSATWYGYAGLIIFIFAIVPPQAWQPPLDKIFDGAGSMILLVLSLATIVYWLSRRNPVEGLVMALPLMILYWQPVMEFIPGPIRNWLTVGMFLLGALAASLLIRINNIRWAIWLVLAASILIGLPIAYARTYWNNIPPEHSMPPSLGGMLGLFSIQFVAGAAIVIGPILGWGVWRLGRSHQVRGRVGAGLIITGVLVNLFGQFSYWRAVSRMDYFEALGISFLYKPDRLSAVLMVGAGLLMILTGVLLLAALTWRKNRLFSIALALLPFVLPSLAMFPIYFGFRIQVPLIRIDFTELSATYNYILLGAGIASIFAGGWMATQLYKREPPMEGAM